MSIITVAPPLSAYLMIIFLSFARDVIQFYCGFDKLYFIFLISFGCKGMSLTLETNDSRPLSLPLGGIQFVLFLTRDSSFSS